MADTKPKEVKSPVVEKQQVTDVPKQAPKPKGPPVIKNQYTNPIEINGVTIPVGGSAPVPGFDPKHKTLARWIESGVIDVN